jgi:PST family polysaccharide transporter
MLRADSLSDEDSTPHRLSHSSHRVILRSAAIVGGSQFIAILLSVVRSKAMAMILGPSGFGIIGMFNSITMVFATVSGMGIRQSGVRQIAEAAGSGDERRLSRTIVTLRRVSILTGALGAIALAILAFPLARLSFGATTFGWGLAILSTTLLFGDVANGQAALIQGLRRIGDLARLTVLGSLFGTLFGIPFVYLWGTAGIAPSLVATSMAGLVTSWWYARRIRVAPLRLTWSETWSEARPLARLGFVFMVSAMTTAGAAYFLRVLVARTLGLEALGLYSAAASLASMYVGSVLGAMGADFYPRLTAVAGDDDVCHRLVNEQAEVGLLVAAPGIIATITFAPLVLRLFFSADFAGAVPVLQWQALGTLLMVLSWPISYILLARADVRAYFWAEQITSGVHVLLIWSAVATLGLVGTGVAYFALYALHWCGVYVLVRRRHGFRWSRSNVALWITLLPTALATLLAMTFMPPLWGTATGTILAAATSAYCIRRLNRALGVSVLSLLIQRLRRIPGRTED